ncbi:MAG: NAD(P)/FAD-dependent oxidoreductase, partial [Planctomycetes bacterium]|nr:NAD(P)/FAD-dependent oxidoreductase [Planctomycetota bacterium]
MPTDRMTRIVILGGGFAGLYAARELERRLGRDESVEITLINRDNFFLFTPMLHEVASAELDLTHIVNPIRKLLRRTSFFHGEVLGIDVAKQLVAVEHGDRPGHPHDLPYDHLVLALGSVTNTYGLSGVAEHALTMATLGDALRLRNRMIDNLEEADFECCKSQRERLLSFVVAGGGFAGVETMGAINDFVRNALRYYRNLEPGDVRMVLVHSGDPVLPELGPSLGRYAQEKLAERGVELRLGRKLKSASGEGVLLDDGSFVPAGTVIWTAGRSAHPLMAAIPGEREGGKLCTDEFLRVKGTENLWALGDGARIPSRPGGPPCPPTAQHASRQGKVLAQNLVAAIRGQRMKPFRFRTLGLLASLGHRTGVAQIFGLRFSGFFAWWLWRTIYLSKLPRFE